MSKAVRYVARWAICAGIGGVVLVNVATPLDLPGFSVRQGVIGTEFMGKLLYMIGTYWKGMALVSAVYFAYGAAVGILAGMCWRVVIRRRSRS
jgi:hypothetical protein